jgi:hypothetical protein
MNLASSNLLTSYLMVSHLSGVYLLSFCLIGLYAGSKSNLCSITSLGIPDISDIWHAKTSIFFWRKVTSASSYLASKFALTWSFLSKSLGSGRTSLSMTSFFLSWRLISSLKGVEEYCWLVTWVPMAHSECCRQASWPF